MINTNVTSNIPVNVRVIAAFLKDLSPEEANAEFYSGDTNAQLLKAEKAWDVWFEKSFPCKKSAELANEVADVVIELCRAYEQAAFEKGMKAGARLMLELLGGGNND